MRDYEYCLSSVTSGDALSSKTSGTQTQAGNVLDMWGASSTIYEDGWGSSIGIDIGEDGNVYVNCRVAVTLVGASSIQLVQIYEHTSASSIKSGTKLAEFAIPAATVAGNVFGISVPKKRLAARYLGVVYQSSGATLTSGTFHTWIGRHADTRYIAT